MLLLFVYADRETDIRSSVVSLQRTKLQYIRWLCGWVVSYEITDTGICKAVDPCQGMKTPWVKLSHTVWKEDYLLSVTLRKENGTESQEMLWAEFNKHQAKTVHQELAGL